ncbi:MAG TPA: hypothetical protein VFZ60_07835 [Nitrososphaeraceae archaeon]
MPDNPIANLRNNIPDCRVHNKCNREPQEMGHNNAGYGATDEEWDLPFNCRYDTVVQRNTNTLTNNLNNT